MLDLILVRHGVTDMNREGCWQGWEDHPLSGRGREQAARVAAYLARMWAPVQAVYASPLLRAWQTAGAVGSALGLEPVPEPGLKECNFGEAGGLRIAEFEERFPGLYERWTGGTEPDFGWPGGESRGAFFQRVSAAIDGIIHQWPDGRVVVVAHGGSLRAALLHLLPQRFPLWWKYELQNCSVSVVRLAEGVATLERLNEVGHLAGLTGGDTASRSYTGTHRPS